MLCPSYCKKNLDLRPAKSPKYDTPRGPSRTFESIKKYNVYKNKTGDYKDFSSF